MELAKNREHFAKTGTMAIEFLFLKPATPLSFSETTHHDFADFQKIEATYDISNDTEGPAILKVKEEFKNEIGGKFVFVPNTKNDNVDAFVIDLLNEGDIQDIKRLYTGQIDQSEFEKRQKQRKIQMMDDFLKENE